MPLFDQLSKQYDNYKYVCPTEVDLRSYSSSWVRKRTPKGFQRLLLSVREPEGFKRLHLKILNENADPFSRPWKKFTSLATTY